MDRGSVVQYEDEIDSREIFTTVYRYWRMIVVRIIFSAVLPVTMLTVIMMAIMRIKQNDFLFF